MPAPLTRIRFGAGWPPGPGSVSCGITMNVPPPGWAGVLARMPTTRPLNGPTGDSEVSCVVPRPRTPAADGEASTGTTAGAVPEDGPTLAAGKDGYGVVAVTAAELGAAPADTAQR